MSLKIYDIEALKEEIKTLTGLTLSDECPSGKQLYIQINVNKVCGTLSKIGDEDKNQKYDVYLTESTIWLTNPDISSDELWRINAKLLELLPSFCRELDFNACTECSDNTKQNPTQSQFFCVEHDTICVCDVLFTDLTPNDDE